MARAVEDLRVLVVHNRYRSGLPSGENNVVDAEISELRSRGVEVSTHIRSSDEIDVASPVTKVTLPIRPSWSPTDSRAVASLIERHDPHVLQLHNPYPLVSPAVVRTAHRRGVPVVHTVHNYRHSCLNGLHLRDGEVCTKCVGRAPALPAVRYGCYRDSRLQSASLAAAEWVHQGTWRGIDRFLALSEFMAEQLRLGGLPGDRITVKPNSVDDPGAPTGPGSGFFFAGRLERAKGIELLLDAWSESGLDGAVPLVIAGDGELRDTVERRAAAMESVEVTGTLDRDEMSARFRASAATVIPAVSFEGPPTVLLESFAHGRPVVATRIGSFTDSVGERVGWLAAPDALSLASVMRTAAEPNGKHLAARREFERRYRREVVTDQLLDVLREVGR